MALSDSTPVSLIAGADLTGKLYYCGKINSSGRLVVCSVAGERVDAIIGSEPSAAAQAADGFVERRPKVLCGGSITAGDDLATDANGKAVTATTGQYVFGKALEAGAAGRVISFLRPLAQAITGGIVAVAAPGAIPPTARHVLLSVDGADAFTLAAGVEGHEITIDCIAAANTPLGTLTLADAFGSEPLTHTFTAAGQLITFVMTSTGWRIVEFRQAGTDLRTTDGAFNPLCSRHSFEIADTKAYSLVDGFVCGQIASFYATAHSGTPAATITASFEKLSGAAASASFAANATGDYTHCRWNGQKWQELVSNSVTYA